MRLTFNFFVSSIFIVFFGFMALTSCKSDDDCPSGKLYPKKITLVKYAPNDASKDTVSTVFIYDKKEVEEFKTTSTNSGKVDTLEFGFINGSTLSKEVSFKVTNEIPTPVTFFDYTYYSSESLVGLINTRTQKSIDFANSGSTESFLYNTNKTLKLYKKLNEGVIQPTEKIDQKIYFNYTGEDIRIQTLVDTTKVDQDMTINKVKSIVYYDYDNPFFNKPTTISLANTYGVQNKINVIMGFLNKLPRTITAEFQESEMATPVEVITTFESFRLQDGKPTYFEVYQKRGTAAKVMTEKYTIEYERKF